MTKINSTKRQYKILSGSAIPKEYIEKSHELDEILYESEDTSPVEKCLNWYEENNEIYTIAIDEKTEEVIACINIMPLTEKYYTKIRNGEYKDTYLPTEAILKYDKIGYYDLYVSSVAINPKNNDVLLLRELIDFVAGRLIEFSERGILCRRIMAEAVSKKGMRLCEIMGMEEVKNLNNISNTYEAKLMPPKFKTPTEKVKELYRIYKIISEVFIKPE
ncbi:MAG: hypothetical protein RRZ70_02195 [Synergistaceae bacterium]